MFDAITPTVFSDRDRRWLVHSIAALHNLVEDEILFQDHAYHDPQISEDMGRFVRLSCYVHALIAAGMEHTHADEAALVQAETEAYCAATLATLVRGDSTGPSRTKEATDAPEQTPLAETLCEALTVIRDALAEVPYAVATDVKRGAVILRSCRRLGPLLHTLGTLAMPVANALADVQAMLEEIGEQLQYDDASEDEEDDDA